MNNVTLGHLKEQENSYFPCPVCGEMLLVEMTKNTKPYVKCNDCGVQLFIRGRLGIARFKQLLARTELPNNCRDLIRHLDYFQQLGRRLQELQEDKPIFGNNPDIDFQEQLIRSQLSRLRRSMSKEAHR